MAVKKRKRYDDKFRASAVVMLEAAGYPKNVFKLKEVADSLNVPRRTLARWYTGVSNPPSDNIVQQEKTALADLFENAARVYLTHAVAADVVVDVPGQAAMTAAAIAVDKMQLLRGLPTEIIGMLPEVIAALKSLGQDPADVFNRIIQRAAQEAST